MTRSGALTLELCYRLFGVDEEDGLRALVTAARAAGHTLPPFVMSLARANGIPLGSGASDELVRVGARIAEYRAIADEITTSIPGARIVKGPTLAGDYPDGVLRPAGDLDVIVRDEHDLWRAAHLVQRRHVLDPVEFTLLDTGSTRHVVLSVYWPADDPVLDEDLCVELCTPAFVGDLTSVPIRPRLPEDTWLANLLAICEERFQRPYKTKDLFDLLILGEHAPADLEPLAATVIDYRLAPELIELIEYAETERVPVGPLRSVAALLVDAARSERERRQSAQKDVTARYGFALGPMAARPEREVVHLHEFSQGVLALTPIGDFLLVEEEIVKRRQYDAAVAELGRIRQALPA
jgi:hypothetical protein